MFLYNLTICRPTGVQQAVYGNFSAPKVQEILVSRGKVLELLRPDELGKLQIICSTEVFGVIRHMAPFRLTGAQQDHIIIASDSGRIALLQYKKEKNSFVRIHLETFGKSGCRRIVPGQYLAVDPKGRACMIGAMEKQKLVYVLNRDAATNITISSPLEAHKSHNIVFSLVGLDMGFDNPVFAAIELDYSDADQDATGEAASEAQKHLTLYELDLGLNHVVRKYSEAVDNGANMLVPVPGGGDGPGGMLVCAENFVIYRNQDHPEVRAVIPRRANLHPERGVLIVTAAVHKSKTMYFFLLQSEYGDIYKVTLDADTETVKELKIQYFDTIPPCTSLCVLKTGFLFACSDAGNQGLYQFQSLGDDNVVDSSSASLMETEDGYAPVFFEPRPLQNLSLVDEMSSLCPLIACQAANLLNEEISQLYCLCGAGARSTLRVLRPGVPVQQLAVSPLPGNPTAVWTIKKKLGDEFDAYIIVSFTNATLVLSIGETVEEVSDSGFLGTSPTVRVQLLSDNSMLQVHPGGLRHIRSDRRINEWRAPGRRTIHRATTNESQVIIALTGGELIYFELMPTGQLMEIEKKDLSTEVSALDVAPIPVGRQRAPFLAVATYSEPVRILSLEQEDCLKALSSQQLTSPAESLLFLESPSMGQTGTEEGAGVGALFLHIGLNSGVMLRTGVDRVSGKLTNTSSRFLGTKPPKLFPVTVRKKRSMLALSSRPWLGYSDMGRYNFVPLSYEALDYACSFSSDQCVEGFCAVAKNTLRILNLERLGEPFNQQVMRLRYTPRKMTIVEETKMIAILESDHAAVPLAEREESLENGHAMPVDGQLKGFEFDEEKAAQEEQFGAPKGPAGQWASCIRLVDPAGLETTCVLELENNEAAFSLCTVRFADSNETVLAVGTAQNLKFYPRECTDGHIKIYRFVDNGRQLELVHSTPTGGIVGALHPYKGRLLAGVGPILRLYDRGKKKLLRKSEHRRLPVHIVSITARGERIFVCDAQESVHMFKYKKLDNVLYEFADDIAPRHITASLPIDYNSVACGDKFGNFFVARLPGEISNKVEDDPSGGKMLGPGGFLNGAPNKVEDVINFHVGDIITSINVTSLQPGANDFLLYTTLTGGIGVFIPFTNREDVDFFSHVEMHMRQEHPPLLGRDHLAYRSSHFPVKDVIDGDLCEQFVQVPPEKQAAIAEELDKTPGEVCKKLEDIRNRIL